MEGTRLQRRVSENRRTSRKAWAVLRSGSREATSTKTVHLSGVRMISVTPSVAITMMGPSLGSSMTRRLLDAEVRLLDRLVLAQALGRIRQHNRAGLQHVASV